MLRHDEHSRRLDAHGSSARCWLVFAAWFVVVHADGFLPAIGTGRRRSGLPPFPSASASWPSACSTGASRPTPRSGSWSCTARFGAMLHLSATSYATNKVVKSAGAAGLVPFLAHADRAGDVPGARERGVPRHQARRDGLALLLDRSRGRRRRRDRRLHGGRALGRGRRRRVYALVVGAVPRAHRRATLAGAWPSPPGSGACAFRVPSSLRHGPHPEPGRACAGHELSCAMDRMRADPRAAVPAARDRLRREAARLCRAVPGAQRAGDPPRPGDDAARVHPHPHGRVGRPPARRHRHRRRIARRAPRGERRAGTVGGRRGRRVPTARSLVAASRGRRCRCPAVPAEPHTAAATAAETRTDTHLFDTRQPLLAAVGAD